MSTGNGIGASSSGLARPVLSNHRRWDETLLNAPQMFQRDKNHADRLRVFSGTSNPGLAQEVACYLGLELGKIHIKRFADGEIYVQVGESIRGCDVFLVQPTAPPVNDNLMELLVTIDA